MITIKTKDEIQKMREGGSMLADILQKVAGIAVPGASTADLNAEAERLIRARGAIPSFLGYAPSGAPMPYPAALCTSVNDEVVHVIPSKRVLKEGDIVGLDLGLWYKGLCVDAAITVGVGAISAEAKKLITTTREALSLGIAEVKDGAYVGDIGCAVQCFVEKRGFSVVRDLAGHGVGHAVHEEPFILNFGKKGTGELLKEGMTLAIEPMVNEGGWRVKIDEDGWGIRTADGSLSAQFEHTVAVTKEGCEILTKVQN